MHSIRQKCRPKHQVLILKCYPRTTKGAVDVKPNSSELSYLLFYATTRRSKVQKVGAFLEKKTASDVWRARIGNVQVTLQILAALIEKAPRDLPLYAPYVLKIFNLILRSQDITMAEASIPTFEAFCEHHDMASLSADQEYLHQYEEIVRIYASFASTRQENKAQSAPVAIRWRTVGLQAVKSVASSEALATVAGRQLDVVVPILLENIWTDNEDFINLLQNRAETEEQMGTEKTLLKRRASNATVGTVDTAGAHPTTVSDTTADADKMAEENIGVLAIQCLKQIFVVNNRSQIHGATTAVLKFISDRVAQQESVIETGTKEHCRGWAPRVFDLITRWTPVQDRYVILVTAMDNLVRTAQVEATLTQQLVLATMVDYLLKSDINLIGLSVMDVLLGLIQQILIILQLGNVGGPHLQPDNGADEKTGAIGSATTPVTSENVPVPTETRIDLLARLQSCIGSLATHVYYADQISDMVSALLSRLKPSPSISATVAAIENPAAAMNTIASNAELSEDSSTDGFFSFDTAKIKALEAIKLILLVASHKSMTVAGSLGRNRVPVKVWEGTQWLLRDSDGRVRKAYADALLTWLDKEITKSDQRVFDERPRALTKSARDDSATNPSKRAVSNASRTEKPAKPVRSTFLQLLHLAIYENALQYVDNENDIVLLHLLLARLVNSLGVNAVRSGLPMIFKLQEDVQEIDLAIHRIRLGSLCLGYFWILCEKFEFEGSPIGRAIQEEILRRQKGRLWDDRIRFPPIRFDQIGTPGSTTPVSNPPNQAPEEVAFTPFNDRFEMVKLISLSYAASLNSPPASPSASPGRSFTHPILSADAPAAAQDHILSDKIKDQLMSEWSKESVIAVAQESSKTASINGSKTGTNTTTHRNFLAVHGLSNGGSQSGTASSAGGHGHRSSANSTYGTVNGLGTLHKLRKGNGQSPAATSESSRGSVTRVDQLKRILSGQPGTLPSTRAGATHSDGSSESMVSYDFSASEISVNTFNQQNASGIERSASMPESERSRSKSRDRIPSYLERPLASYAIASDAAQDDTNIPPVPPLPSSLAGENIAVQDQAQVQSSPEAYRTGRSAKRSTKSRAGGYSNMPWGEENDKVVDLQDLLNGIEISGEHERGNVAKPPY